ncbi:MAG TPA: NAD(P)-binding oxidoreductase [Thermoanaerobaculia bacterium]
MKLLILGATGPTGHQLVSRALEAGHSVAALVRDPRKVTETIEVIEGDATNASAVAGAARGRDAIVSALGTSKSLKGGIMMRAVPVLLPAMQQNGVKRLIFQSSFGVAESFDEATAIQKFFFRTLLRSIYADKAKADAMIEASPLEWTIVRPVRLTNGPRTGKYHVSERFDARGPKSVSRADVADFMIGELTERKWIRKIAVIA